MHIKCPHYRDEIRHITAGSDGTTYSVPVAWCEHANSPCTVEEVNNIGGPLKLRCLGDITKCELRGGYPERLLVE